MRWSDLVREAQFYPRMEENFNEYIEALLSVFTNVTMGTVLTVPGLADCLIERFLTNPAIYSGETLYRSLLTLTRMKHT